MNENVGILHPGEMGVFVAASAGKSGKRVYWVSEGRSEATGLRAEKHGLVDAGTLAALCSTCRTILSVCPPHAAEVVAKQAAESGFKGLYVDANAINPQRAVRIGQMLEERGISFVDGGIIGGPDWEGQGTWLYLAGREAQQAAALFRAGALQTEVLGESIGAASALKMCYAAYTKGTTALLCAILGAAENLDVRQALMEQWKRDGSGLDESAPRRARRVTAKAWRFEGEMKEIAATMEEAGMPDGFHEAAAEVFRRLAGFRGRTERPELAEVLQALRDGKKTQPQGGKV